MSFNNQQSTFLNYLLEYPKANLSYIILYQIKMEGYSHQNTLLSNDDTVRLEIFISARGLLDMDVFSKSDPYVKVFFKRVPSQPWANLGRTQTIDNNLNPNFTKSFIVDYVFEARQEMKFEVYDEDDKTNSNQDDFIGSVETTLGALAGARDQTSILNLKGQKPNPGKIILRVQPCVTSKYHLKMKWRAKNLMNTDSWFDWWDKSDPYLKLLKIRKDKTLVEAFRTQIKMEDLNPNWNQFQISQARLIREDNPQQMFKAEVWDWEKQGQPKHQFIGETYLTMPQLMQSKLPVEIPLNNPKQKKPGKIVLQKFIRCEKPTFIDYIRGGLQLNLSVAIDFTASNGTPTSNTSLHYMNPNMPNQYQKAIQAVGNILLNYDYDKMIPAFGFGAKTHFPKMNSTTTNHCFPLSGRNDILQAGGIDGLMSMYANSLMNVSLSGPTYFGPILDQFVQIARQSHKEGGRVYQILLILTDGTIHDMDKTVSLLVNNCSLPLSIIIVGIGNADFGNMNVLDGDNGLFDSKGRKAQRDIVQFVPFNQVAGNPDVLAKQLLAQLPDQVVQYMTMMGYAPGKPPEVNVANLLQSHPGNIEQNLKQNLPALFQGLATLNVKDPSQY